MERYLRPKQDLKRSGRELDSVIGELRQRLEMEGRSLHGLYRPADQY